MPGVARGISSSRYSSPPPPSPPPPPSHLKLMANRISSLQLLNIPLGSLRFLRVPLGSLGFPKIPGIVGLKGIQSCFNSSQLPQKICHQCAVNYLIHTYMYWRLEYTLVIKCFYSRIALKSLHFLCRKKEVVIVKVETLFALENNIAFVCINRCWL